MRETIQHRPLIIENSKKLLIQDIKLTIFVFSVLLTGRCILIIAELGLFVELSSKIAMQSRRVVL